MHPGNYGDIGTNLTVQQIIDAAMNPQVLISVAIVAVVGILAAWALGAEL